MSKPNCFLFTISFPFGRGETFVENEVSYLSESFENVYVFTYSRGNRNKLKKKYPPNFCFFPLNIIDGKTKYLIYSLKGLLFTSNDLKLQGKNLKQIFAELYYRGRGNQALKRAIKIIDKEKLETEVSTFYSYWFSDLAYVACKLAEKYRTNGKVKCVSRAHGYDVYWERNFTQYLPFQRVCLEKIDGVYVCSQNGADYLKEKNPLYRSIIQVAHLGTRDIGLAKTYSGEKVLATCCSLNEVKRMKLFAEAFVKLKRKVKNAKWICIGDGPQMQEIRRIVSEVISDVQFLGTISNDQVYEIYRKESISFFCNVSSSEGIPVSIMEAMSMGIPCIATAVGGTPEIVDKECGYLLSKNVSSEELAFILVKMLGTDEEKYQRMRMNARRKWEEGFSAEVNYKKWMDIIR